MNWGNGGKISVQEMGDGIQLNSTRRWGMNTVELLGYWCEAFFITYLVEAPPYNMIHRVHECHNGAFQTALKSPCSRTYLQPVSTRMDTTPGRSVKEPIRDHSVFP